MNLVIHTTGEGRSPRRLSRGPCTAEMPIQGALARGDCSDPAVKSAPSGACSAPKCALGLSPLLLSLSLFLQVLHAHHLQDTLVLVGPVCKTRMPRCRRRPAGLQHMSRTQRILAVSSASVPGKRLLEGLPSSRSSAPEPGMSFICTVHQSHQAPRAARAYRGDTLSPRYAR